jgi:hypothetical protein
MARGEDRAESDVGLAVEIEPGRAFSLIRFEETGFCTKTASGGASIGRNFQFPARVSRGLRARQDHDFLEAMACPQDLRSCTPLDKFAHFS